ncbi:putative phenylacetyl-CoA ligase [Aspergillus sergii]|uniref:Putative phenylacetyl-CoA ligase n=1 Tax=Aspergillus sergii TaxID=1034303 RepID=A0A5N6XF99_9EURO|nr:putative phenylacetyl-CoA ligase [Aspergillus sergii]
MTTVPPIGIWKLLFEQRNRPFPNDHVIFQSASSNKSYTYNDVKFQAGQFGSAVRSTWNWSKGDVLVLMSPNSIEMPSVVWGCHYAGGVVAPVNPDLSVSELKHHLERSHAKALVVHPKCIRRAKEAMQLAQMPPEHLLALDENVEGIMTVKQFMDEPQRDGGEAIKFEDQNPQDLAFLVYSSGTTGLPKGVMISHQNVVAAVVLQAGIESPHVHWESDRMLAALPVYHIYGLICLMHLPLWLGIRAVFMEKFDLHDFCRIVQEERITLAYIAPPVVLHLTKNPIVDEYNLSSLKMMTSGGAPLAVALIKELYKQRQLPVRQAYGLSETTSVSHIQRQSNWQCGIGSNGPPLPGLEAKYVLPDGAIAATNGEGELWIRGPTVFTGYKDEPGMSAACLTPDGWFKTGDIGYEDSQRNLFITDRMKDMIKFKGYQVAPAELEDILLLHPAVKDVAVIGVMNEDLQSEVPLAYITLKEGAPESERMARDLIRHVKSRVLSYKQLRGGIIWASQIPRSPSGKILKRVLRDRTNRADKGKAIGSIIYERYHKAKI